MDNLEGLSLKRLIPLDTNERVKRADFDPINDRIQAVGKLDFDSMVVPTATIRRKIACFFVFDKEASADLNNSRDYADKYATRLAELVSKYTAHANILVTNAGTEMWSNGDQISFAVGTNSNSPMTDIVAQFQTYLANTKNTLFGTVYAAGVLISYKPSLVAGGYSQGPLCTTSGVSLINYRQSPWIIAGLLAHELAHTLSVVHTFELSSLCDIYKTELKFCAAIPDECLCASNTYPPQKCLMTYQFGQSRVTAPRYTSCDIEMMNHFSPNISCVNQVSQWVIS